MEKITNDDIQAVRADLEKLSTMIDEDKPVEEIERVYNIASKKHAEIQDYILENRKELMNEGGNYSDIKGIERELYDIKYRAKDLIDNKTMPAGRINFASLSTIRRVAAIGAGVILVGGLVGACSITTHKDEEAEVEDLTPKAEVVQVIDTEEEVVEEDSFFTLQAEKESQILDLVQDLRYELNSIEGINITTEQALALYIHLNVGNSYINANDTLALDKITRENLVKMYYVGLTQGTEEFDNYEIEDDDLAKLSANVMEMRNALVNRAIVLNDEGRYEESKQIIRIIGGFVTEENLQDEISVLTTSIANMQTNDDKKLKEEVYRYYNYIFAGPKSDVRNFDGYAPYLDADNNEMTFENQGMTMRFATWFLDAFVDIRISGKNLIPQDIINSKEAKLRDQATLMRALGYKNEDAFCAHYCTEFDEPIDNKTTKKSTGKKNYSKATGTKVDSEIDSYLTNNATVGASTVLSDGSTMTVIEAGERSTTIIVAPDPSSAVTTITTPSGETSRTEIIGGGNETIEEIVFPEDDHEEVIESGGEVIETYDLDEAINTSSIDGLKELRNYFAKEEKQYVKTC